MDGDGRWWTTLNLKDGGDSGNRTWARGFEFVRPPFGSWGRGRFRSQICPFGSARLGATRLLLAARLAVRHYEGAPIAALAQSSQQG
jgi:hypothetical protein